MFSAGHDMGSKVSMEEYTPGPNQHPTRAINGATRKGAENLMLQEWHYFFDNTRRWRNLRKITIGQAHGDVYAAGLMLLWACDLIVCDVDTRFADVVGSRLGMCGVEYFASSVGVRSAQGEGAPADGRRHRRRRGAPARHDQQGLPAPTTLAGADDRVRACGSRNCRR